MFCNKCGKEIANEAKFCTSCGEQNTRSSQPPVESAPVIQESAAEYPVPVTPQSVYADTAFIPVAPEPQPKKGLFKRLAIVTAAVLVLFVGIIGTVPFVFPAQVNMLLLSKPDHVAKLEMNQMDSGEKLLSMPTLPMGQLLMDIAFNVGGETVTANLDASINGKKMYFDTNFSVEAMGESYDIAIKCDGENVLFDLSAFPKEITDAFGASEFYITMNDYDSADMSEIFDLIKPYFKSAITGIPDASIKLDKKAVVNGISCNSYTVMLDKDVLCAIVDSLCETAETDDKLQSFLEKYDVSDTISSFNTGKVISKALKEFKHEIPDDFEMKYVVYFTNQENIIRRTIEAEGDVLTIDTTDKRQAVTAEADGDIVFRAENSFETKKGNIVGKFEIEVPVFNYNSYEMELTSYVSATYTLEAKNDGTHLPVGKVSFTMYKDMTIEYETKKVGDSYETSIVAHDSETEVYEVTISSKFTKKNVEKPEISIDDAKNLIDSSSQSGFTAGLFEMLFASKYSGQSTIMRHLDDHDAADGYFDPDFNYDFDTLS